VPYPLLLSCFVTEREFRKTPIAESHADQMQTRSINTLSLSLSLSIQQSLPVVCCTGAMNEQMRLACLLIAALWYVFERNFYPPRSV
jgi:hypothetical protein